MSSSIFDDAKPFPAQRGFCLFILRRISFLLNLAGVALAACALQPTIRGHAASVVLACGGLIYSCGQSPHSLERVDHAAG
jgi:hypothetical protein